MAPSEAEVEICSRAFGAPEGAERVNRAQRAIHPGTKRLVDWRVVELRWIERKGDEWGAD